MKRFYNDHQIKFYMYAFMYIDPEIISEDYYFPDIGTFVKKYKKISPPGPVEKHWLGLIYISSEYYELYLNFYGNETKI